MPEAARLTDPTVHTGKLAYGEPTVLIANLPASRLGDPHACPAHGPGVVITASATVFIGCARAARKDDLVGCAGTGTIGIGVPPVIAAPDLVANHWRDFLTTSATDTNQDGAYDTRAFFLRAFSRESKSGGYSWDMGPVDVGVKGLISVLYVKGQGTVRTGDEGSGIDLGPSAEGGVLKLGGEAYVGPEDDWGANPYLAVGLSGDAVHGAAGGDVFVGDDGQRVGFNVVGGFGAELGSAGATKTVTVPLDWAPGVPDGWNVQTKDGLGFSGGSTPGGNVGLWAYWDKSEGRLHAGFALGLDFMAGFSVSKEMSLGMKYKPPVQPGQETSGNGGGSGGGDGAPGTEGTGAGGIPNPIAMGCPTVFIGG